MNKHTYFEEFPFKYPPYQHQRKALQLSAFREFYGLFMEMGTGKTKVIIDTMAALYDFDEINGALIIAPKGAYRNWSDKELPEHWPFDEDPDDQPYVAVWRAALKKDDFMRLKRAATPDTPGLTICVMNVEALSSKKALTYAVSFLRNRRALMVVDESTSIKNLMALRTKNIINISKYAKYRRILTGTPITKNPLDLFSQCSFLSRKIFKQPNYFSFRARYAELEDKYGAGGRTYKVVTGFKRLHELQDILKRHTFRVTKDECLDLPPKVYERREVDHTEEQRRLYTQMVEESIAQLDAATVVTATMVISQLIRLQQINCGFINTEDGPRTLDNNRLGQLLEILDEFDGKAIIWASFHEPIMDIERALSERYGPSSVATYYGSTPGEQRQGIVGRFQNPHDDLRFFVGNPRTGGYGLTLTQATLMVYYNNSYDLEVRLQSEDRAHRVGQTKSVTYIDMVTPGTIDEVILGTLKQKQNLADLVLKVGWRQTFEQLRLT